MATAEQQRERERIVVLILQFDIIWLRILKQYTISSIYTRTNN